MPFAANIMANGDYTMPLLLLGLVFLGAVAMETKLLGGVEIVKLSIFSEEH